MYGDLVQNKVSLSNAWSACPMYADVVQCMMSCLVPNVMFETLVSSAMYWTGYEVTKSYVLATKGHSNLTFYESFGAGALAGSVSF